LIRCSKSQLLIFVMRQRKLRLISATASTQLALMHWSHNWCKFKHS